MKARIGGWILFGYGVVVFINELGGIARLGFEPVAFGIDMGIAFVCTFFGWKLAHRKPGFVQESPKP